ncbi:MULTISPECIES: OmpA family protein [unclassified Pseudomonas]|uniref:OmpA family protein n=1 Tax=unclassified Pseudomonas TaxID=196821 RepID=UPI000489EE77|nr:MULTISPECIES: OmpA family protein [unclassified Pseudomonas]MBD9397429.1 OmpA family protein [Pseudomonas sp. PDM11]PZW68736.1 outer membrane protein OmpA-like peptidoglycan-associated protein [Pseudomonas sp. URMO17WK12:I1]
MFANPLRLIALLLCALLASGCASKSYVVLVESPDGSTGAIEVKTDKGMTRVDQKGYAVNLDGSSAAPFQVEQPRFEKDFSAARAAQPALPKSYLLYFRTGGAKLTAKSQAEIPEILQTVRDRGPSAVSVIGHTDTVGSKIDNEDLGLLRARAIARQLQENGLQAIELVVTSHGEGNLLVKTPDNTPEPANRRVEITIR